MRPILATGKFPDDAPIAAQFAVERRSLAELPSGLDLAGLAGEVEMHGYARGTLAKPFIVIEAVGKGIHYVGLAARSPATFDLHWLATADVNGIASELDVQSIEDHVLHGSLRIDAAPRDLLRPGAAWGADLNLETQNFPLSFVPFFADHAVRGAVSGKVGIAALHRAPEIHGDLTIDDLKVGRETAGHVELTFDSKSRRARPRFRSAATLPIGTAPYLHAQGRGACWFADNIRPTFDPALPVEMALGRCALPPRRIAADHRRRHRAAERDTRGAPRSGGPCRVLRLFFTPFAAPRSSAIPGCYRWSLVASSGGSRPR